MKRPQKSSILNLPRSVRVPQQARSRRTRERIIESAAICFERHGYNDATTALIADHAGIGVGTLYGYFRDKRELLLELLTRWSSEIIDVVLARLDPEAWEGGDVREHTRSLIDALFHMQTMRPAMQRILWERYFKDPDFQAPMESVRERCRVAVAEFGNAVDSGQLRTSIDIETASLTVVNAVQWNALHAFMHGTPDEIDRAAASTADMVARFLFEDEPRTNERLASS